MGREQTCIAATLEAQPGAPRREHRPCVCHRPGADPVHRTVTRDFRHGDLVKGNSIGKTPPMDHELGPSQHYVVQEQ